MLTLIYKPDCETCRKAMEWLDSRGLEYTLRDLKTHRPDADELRAWHLLSGMQLASFWNTAETSFRSLRVFTGSRILPREQQYLIMTADADLIMHPILIGDDFALPGFSKNEWEKRLEKYQENVDKS